MLSSVMGWFVPLKTILRSVTGCLYRFRENMARIFAGPIRPWDSCCWNAKATVYDIPDDRGEGGLFVSALSGGPQNRQSSAVAFSALGRGDADPPIGVSMALQGVVFFLARVSCAS